MSGWPGLRAALATDPDGVAAVLRTVRAIPVSADRAASSPPLWAEIARMIETESGWRPDARHPQTDASGLIQWMPSTARIYGLTTAEIRAMSRADQAPLVQRYFATVARHYGGLRRPGDAYVAGAYPVALSYSPDRVIAEQGSAIWQQNKMWRDSTVPGEPVTVRRLLEIGQPPAVPDDLRTAVLALVPDIETAHTISGSSGQTTPAPAPSGASGQTTPVPSGSSGQTTPVPSGSSGQTTPVPSGSSGQGGTGPVSARPTPPAQDRWAEALVAVAILAWAAARRGCL